MLVRELNIGADILLRLKEVFQTRTGTACTNATVTARVYRTAVDVASLFATVTCTFVTGTDTSPIYEGTLAAATSANLVEGDTYWVVFTAVSATLGTDKWTIECIARARGMT